MSEDFFAGEQSRAAVGRYGVIDGPTYYWAAIDDVKCAVLRGRK